LRNGEDNVHDLGDVAQYCQYAAEQGLAETQFNYDICLWNGKFVCIDLRSVTYYFKLASDQGHINT
jgi:TPR repeat protein